MKSKIVYKLTDENGQTRGAAQWAPGVTHSGTGEGGLCGPGFIHYYSDPLLAILLNPIHGDFSSPRLWEAEPSGKILSDSGLKFGSVSLTTLREISIPEVTTEHRVRFAIFCALEVCSEPAFVKWAEGWLSGVDRSKEAAGASVGASVGASAWAAWAAVAGAAEWAAVEWTAVAGAAWAAERAAGAAAMLAAERAAAVAMLATVRAAKYGTSFDLVALAKKSVSKI